MSRETKGLLTALFLGVLALAAAACGADPTATATTAPTPTATQEAMSPLDELIAAAQAEGELTLLGSGRNYDPQFLSEVGRAMNNTYGINIRVNVSPGPSGSALVPRLGDENRAGQPASTDILFSPSAQHVELNLDEDASLAVDWHALIPGLDETEVGEHGNSLVIGTSIMHIGYNTNLVDPADLPKVFEDFADPKFEGMIGSTVFAAGWDNFAILHGKDRVKEIMQQMVDNGSIVSLSGTNQYDRVATGEVPIFAFDYNPEAYARRKAEGAPIEVAYMEDMFTAQTFAMSVPKNATHPNLAQLMGVFLASPHGQDLLWQHVGMDSPLRPGSNTYQFFQEVGASGVEVYLHGDKETVDNADIHAGDFPNELSAILEGSG